MPYSLPQDKPVTFRERIYFPEVLRGLAVVTRHFLRNVFFSRDANPDVPRVTPGREAQAAGPLV